MRASYVNGPDLLTPLGEWIASRLPHVTSGPQWNGRGYVFRVFGGSPLYRRCLFDYTRASFYIGQPSWVRVSIVGVSVFERNREFSGLPNARR